MPFLEHEGNTRELRPGDTLVGSGAQADWRLQNVDLAARHFSVALGADGRAMLKPYSAQNVVVVNGRQVPLAGVALGEGDVVAAGLAQFVYIGDPSQPRRSTSGTTRGSAWLINDSDRTAYPLKKRTVSIGRDATSSVPIREPSVSRIHADIRSEAGEYVLYAMGSAGTRINGHGVSAPRLLEEGDKIEIGSTTLRFTREGTPPAGFTVFQGADDSGDDTGTRRATVVAAQAVTGEEPSYRGTSPGRFLIPIGLGVAALIALALWLLSG